ncbi:MAG: hypothetical protein H7062_12745 [Candidatus Saccharimonas sp.]|nr:hypothetical protein [Planctomycetaceae bacterium]
MRRRIRVCGLALLGLCGLIAAVTPARVDAAGGIPLTLAQAAPAPAPVVLPGNVRKAGRLYVVESIVVLALVGGAVYAVCRTSRRT